MLQGYLLYKKDKSLQHKINKLEPYIKKLPKLFISHSDAVGKYTERDEICKATDKENFSCLKLPMPDKAYLIGRYHDIGKSGISNALWESSTRFSDAEYKLAQLHTVIGAHFVKPTLSLAGLSDDSDRLSIIAKCCVVHPERWDGSGYPFGLKGEQIPLYARIVAIADCYDAMIEERPYKKNMSSESAIAEIRQQKGKQFDPVLADIFCEAMLYKKI